MNDLEREMDWAPAEIPGVGQAPAPDLAWESELVQMLSTVESFRARLYDDCTAGRALPALEAMLAVAKGVDAFLRPRFEHGPADALAAVQASSKVFFAAARPLHDRLDDAVLKALLRFLWARRDAADPNLQLIEVGRKLKDFLKTAFALCASRFLSPAAAQTWTETYTVFLAELDDLFEPVAS
jgi:hypothetical protein